MLYFFIKIRRNPMMKTKLERLYIFLLLHPLVAFVVKFELYRRKYIEII